MAVYKYQDRAFQLYQYKGGYGVTHIEAFKRRANITWATYKWL